MPFTEKMYLLYETAYRPIVEDRNNYSYLKRKKKNKQINQYKQIIDLWYHKSFVKERKIIRHYRGGKKLVPEKYLLFGNFSDNSSDYLMSLFGDYISFEIDNVEGEYPDYTLNVNYLHFMNDLFSIGDRSGSYMKLIMHFVDKNTVWFEFDNNSDNLIAKMVKSISDLATLKFGDNNKYVRAQSIGLFTDEDEITTIEQNYEEKDDLNVVADKRKELEQLEKSEFKNSSGVAIVDDKPSWIDVDHMFIPSLQKSEREAYKTHAGINKNAELSFSFNNFTNQRIIWVYDYEKKDDPIWPVNKFRLYLKIENNKMYVSKDGIEWNRLYMSDVEFNPKSKYNIIVRMYLKCNYFEGEYVMYGHPE